MDSFLNTIKTAAASTAAGGDDKTTNPDQTANSGLVSDAKLVAEAAQFVASNQSDKIDKPKVAGAAGDLLDDAKKYGKFDESQGVGKYLKQADDYLHEYEKSGGGGGSAAPPKPAEAPATATATEEKKGEVLPVEEKKGEAPPVEEKKEESGGGFGAADALKAAGSFFGK